MKLSKSIKALLVTFLNESITVASWGITDIQIEENKLSFKVDGLLYKGAIEITEWNGLYKATLSDGDLSSSLDIIVSVLDKKIEKTNDYINDLKDWIESYKKNQ